MIKFIICASNVGRFMPRLARPPILPPFSMSTNKIVATAV